MTWEPKTKKITTTKELIQQDNNIPAFGITKFGSYNYITEDIVLQDICSKITSNQAIVVDLETSGLDPLVDKIFLIAFTLNGREAYVFSPSIINPQPFITLLNRNPIINHNLVFDYKFLKHNYGVKLNIEWDTYITHALSIAGLADYLGNSPNSLGSCCKRYLGVELDKSITADFYTTGIWETPRHIVYAAEDVQATYLLIDITKKLLKASEQEEIWENLEKPLIPVIVDMELMGIQIDLDKALKLREEYQERLDTLETKIDEYLNPYTEDQTTKINPKSSMQLIKWFKTQGVDIPLKDRKNGTTTESLDEESLKKINHPLIPLMLEHRELSKAINTYLTPWTTSIHDSKRGVYNPETESIHPTITQVDTSTGRFCLSKGTRIRVVDKLFEIRDEYIENIVPGMHVLSLDENNDFCYKKVLSAEKTGESQEVWILMKKAGRCNKTYLVCTPEHEVRLKDGSFRAAKDLTASDIFLGIRKYRMRNPFFILEEFTKFDFRKHKELRDVYDIEVEDTNVFFAEDIAVHNSMRNPNPQQVPKDSHFRHIFVSKNNDNLVSTDLSQYELRVLAEVSNDVAMKEIFAKRVLVVEKLNKRLEELDCYEYSSELGEKHKDIKDLKLELETLDMHTQTAINVFKLDPNSIDYGSEDWKNLRAKSKTISFSIPYGGGPATIARRSNLSVKEAEENLKNYYLAFPGVKKYIEDTQKDVVIPKESELPKLLGLNGAISWTQTVDGRRRHYLLPSNNLSLEDRRKQLGSIKRQAVNAKIQSFNASTLKEALIMLYNKFKEPGFEGCHIRLCVHDEIVSTYPSHKKDVPRIQAEILKKASSKFLKEVATESSISVGKEWSK